MSGAGIRVKGYLTFKSIIGERIVDPGSEGLSMSQLLSQLKQEIGERLESEMAKLEEPDGTSSMVILVNGRRPENDLDTRLKEGDEVAIFPPMAGG